MRAGPGDISPGLRGGAADNGGMGKQSIQRQFGRRLRRLRLRAGLTQQALANRIGMDESHLAAIERGEHDVRLGTVAKVAAGLGVAPWKLLKFD